MVPSGNRLQGCPEPYRKPLLTAESHPGLLYSYSAPTHKPPQPELLLKSQLEVEYLPLLSLKHITLLSVARKGELILHVNKKGQE